MIQGSTDRWAKRILSKMSRLVLVSSQASIQWIPEVFFMEGRVARHEASHSPAYSAEVMKNGGVLSLLCAFMAWTGIPLPLLRTDQFTLKISTSHAKYE